MISVSSLCVAFLFGVGVWLLFSRDWLGIILSIGLLGHGVNLLILKSGEGEVREQLPQALVLTAIVIGLGIQTVLLVLACLGSRRERQPDTDRLPEEAE